MSPGLSGNLTTEFSVLIATVSKRIEIERFLWALRGTADATLANRAADCFGRDRSVVEALLLVRLRNARLEFWHFRCPRHRV